MLGNRASQHNFAQVPDVQMARSQFDRSHTVKDTMYFDQLTPCFVDEVIPGDTFNLSLSTFGRLATQKVPIMDNMMINFFFFFVPNRLIWDNWERMNGAQTDPGDSTDFLTPQIVSRATSGEDVGTVWDHFGLPTGKPGLSVTALPFRAMNLIWNDWFRDQNLQDSIIVNKDDGPDLPTEYPILYRNKMHDYFTSCLPWPQKGPAVELPLGTTAPVTAAGALFIEGMTSTSYGEIRNNAGGTNPSLYVNGAAYTAGENMKYHSGLITDLSSATAATINQLRQAIQVQSIYELDARGGTRYVEILQAHFNVVSPDFRLQRPEYLGGGQSNINCHPVAQTAPTTGSDVQAQLASFGTTQSSGNIGFTKSFVEHGYVLGFMCARADVTYQQGINRMWTRETRFDYFWPKLQLIGEQAVLNKEIYAQGTGHTTADEAVFGYQERHADYRYKPSEIRGVFRSTAPLTLDYWHLAEEFSTAPALNSTFIKQNTPIDRAIAVTDQPDLIMDMWFNYKCARPMVSNPVPATFGRF